MKQLAMFPNLAFSHFGDPCGPYSVHQQSYLRLHFSEARQRHVMAKATKLHEQSSALNAEFGPGSEIGGQIGENQKQQDPSRFFELMSPTNSAQPDQMSASSLAYLGDVVFELFVRSRYVWPNRRMSDLQNKVVSIVRADAQSLLLQRFVGSFPLTSTEQGVLARGRNANLTARKKGRSANSGGASAYQDSTAFEALLGYTYISDKHRFNEMISWMALQLDELDSK